MEILGKVHSISNVETSEYNGKEYSKVFITLNLTTFNERTGDEYKNFPRIEFSGDKGIDQVMDVSVGDTVKIMFELRGTNYNDKKTGEPKNFTFVKGWKIEIISKNEQPIWQQDTIEVDDDELNQPKENIQEEQEIDDLPF